MLSHLLVIPAFAHYCQEYYVMPAEAGIQRLKSLDYSIHPCMLPLLHPSMGYALQASLWLFTKIDGFNFEHHVVCNGPKGESQGGDE